jgi:hypothetical protein
MTPRPVIIPQRARASRPSPPGAYGGLDPLRARRASDLGEGRKTAAFGSVKKLGFARLSGELAIDGRKPE